MPQKKVEENESAFKNWISEAMVKRMGKHITQHYRKFDEKGFTALAKELGPLELKARIKLISERLRSYLPEDYSKALPIILKATFKPSSGVAPLSGFDLWPFTEFIHRYGMEDYEASLDGIYQITQVFTGEFAIRPFLIQEEKKTLKTLLKWSKDKNHHVRRLVSEGSRPRLPWGEQLKSFVKDPTLTLPLLENLKYDDELYVRKSVANHLNDISKDNPAIALKTAKAWLKDAPEKHQAKVQWIVRHALRGLLKAGNPEALKLLGYGHSGKMTVKNLKITKTPVRIGESMDFSFDIQSSTKANVMIDYLIHHQKSNGKRTEKVFKLNSKTLEANKVVAIKKKHSFKLITTRVYYPGEHVIEIMVNGHRLAKLHFDVLAAK